MPEKDLKRPEAHKPSDKQTTGIGKLVGLIFLSLLFIGIAIARINSIPFIVNDVFPRNTDLVPVGCYPGIVTQGPGLGTNGEQIREFLFNGHQLRIRQNGTIEKVEFYVNDLTDTDGMFINIWRKNGSRYDRVGESENLAAKLVEGEINSIELERPIQGVREGDFYGIRITRNGPAETFQLTLREDVPRAQTYWFDSNPGNVSVDWEGQADGTGPGDSAIPVRLYMQAPLFVFIGDSILAGFPHCRAFIEQEVRNGFKFGMPYLVSDTLQVTYQNMGVTGQKIAQIEERFQVDCIDLKPRVAVMLAGVNDITPEGIDEDYLQSWDHILTMLEEAEIRAVIFNILPSTAGTIDELRKRDRWNAMVKDMVESRGFIWIDGDRGVGAERKEGDPGNLWDLKPAYDHDGLHYTRAGYAKIAELTLDALEELGYYRRGLIF
jgi:lysophospholipase L1-like esterase